MPRLYVVSDIHSHLTPLKKALDEVGFDPNNEGHWLIVCGDCFDRGDESYELLKYLMQLERRVLVKGNHDTLLEQCCVREFAYSHDMSNGTVKTIQDIGGADKDRSFAECCRRTFDKLAAYKDSLVNYFETKNYVFVHSWIPTDIKFEGNSKPWYQEGKTYSYKEDWRDATTMEWEEAMWGNPFKLAQQDLNKTGKTIVFGHWHCSAGHKLLGNCEDEFKYAIWEPCYFKNTIGIDRCTAYTGEINVLVLEDEFIERQQ